MVINVSFVGLNWIAIILVTVIKFVLGGLWYSEMGFGKTWMKLAGVTKSDMKKSCHEGRKGMLASFVSAFVLAVMFSKLTHRMNYASFFEGARLAVALWLGFIALVQLPGYVFEGRPLKLFALNVGYLLVSFVLMGGILAAWA